MLSLSSLVALLREEDDEQRLEAGEVVATGTMTVPYTLAAGQRLVASIDAGDLAPVELQINP